MKLFAIILISFSLAILVVCDDNATNSPQNFTVVFDANGGTVNTAAGTTAEDGKLENLPVPTRSGYAFAGWFTTPTGGTEVSTSTVFRTNTTIYALWSHMIQFNANGGTVSPTSSITNLDGRLTNLPTPTRDEWYSFDGWFTNVTGGTRVSIDTMYTSNTTIYARWEWISGVQFNPNITYNSFTDLRDGKIYRTIAIDGVTWMAENLNYNVTWCYNHISENCSKYGGLYNWNRAMAACPEGWHLPSQEEWEWVIDVVGGNNAGGKLKSQIGWGILENNTDDFGFSALPGGRHSSGAIGGNFEGLGNYSYWWSATETDEWSAKRWDIDFFDINTDKGAGYSVRCVKN